MIKLALLVLILGFCVAQPPFNHYLPAARGSGSNSAQYTAPSSKFGTSTGQYGQPPSEVPRGLQQGSYAEDVHSSRSVNPSSQNGIPSGHFSSLSSNYGAPSSDYSRSFLRYGTLSNKYGVPNSALGSLSSRNNKTPATQLSYQPSSHYDSRSTSEDQFISSRVSDSQYGASSVRRFLPSSQYSAPSSQYGTPSSQYGTPSSQYGTPSSQYGTPSSQYGTPSSPPSQYGGPYSMRTSAPNSQYGTPSSFRTSPSSQFGSSSAHSSSLSKFRSVPSSPYGTLSAIRSTHSSQYGTPSSFSDSTSSSHNGLPSHYPGSGFSGSSVNDQKSYTGNVFGQSHSRVANGDQHARSYTLAGGNEISEPAKYDFNYDVSDGEQGVEFGQEESRDGEETNGSYHVLLPDGRRQRVQYTAGQYGYKPTISYENTGTLTTGRQQFSNGFYNVQQSGSENQEHLGRSTGQNSYGGSNGYESGGGYQSGVGQRSRPAGSY
ncbi:uncharacterized protein [Rhodnius prolixus]|uniref:uncharacterized protein n=1 Tax=Rhodnius prolixus TaxID=13249 RepID=UPI003D18EC3E